MEVAERDLEGKFKGLEIGCTQVVIERKEPGRYPCFYLNCIDMTMTFIGLRSSGRPTLCCDKSQSLNMFLKFI